MRTAEQIQAERDFIRSELDAIHEGAVTEDAQRRTYTDDEQERWDAGIAYLDVLKVEDEQRAELHALALLESKDYEVNTTSERRHGEQAGRMRHADADRMDAVIRAQSGVRGADREVRDHARRLLDEIHRDDPTSRQHTEKIVHGHDMSMDTPDSAAVAGRVAAQEIVVRGTEAYRGAFEEYMRSAPYNESPRYTAEQEQAVWHSRALVGGTTDAGGLQLPTHVDPTLIQPDKDFLGSIRPYCRNVTLPSGARTWNGVSATSGAIEWLGPDVDPVTREATEIDPTQTAVSVATNLAVAYMTASIEYDQDVGGGANVARVFDNARAREESTVFVTGSGTNRPTGIVTALDAVTTSEVDTDTTLVLDADDVNDLLYSELPVGYHDSARWLMHPAILAHIQGLETNVVLTNRGNLPRDANLGRDILGRPVHLTGAMDSSTNPLVINEQVIVLGDFMAYIIVDRMAPELVFLGHQYGANQRPTGHVGWALFYRQGGGIGSTTTGVGAPANALRLLSIL